MEEVERMMWAEVERMMWAEVERMMWAEVMDEGLAQATPQRVELKPVKVGKEEDGEEEVEKEEEKGK